MGVESEFRDQVNFIGVPGLSNDAEEKANFLNETGANTFPTVIEGDDLWDRFDVSRQGTFVFVNQDGTWQKEVHPSSLTEQVEALIAR